VTRPALDEVALATLDGEAGPGITAWCSGVRKPCVCGHAPFRHGEVGGASCGYLGCTCPGFRAALSSPATNPEPETKE
jgi:hypothetical protein